jgi:hypothetical protein
VLLAGDLGVMPRDDRDAPARYQAVDLHPKALATILLPHRGTSASAANTVGETPDPNTQTTISVVPFVCVGRRPRTRLAWRARGQLHKRLGMAAERPTTQGPRRLHEHTPRSRDTGRSPVATKSLPQSAISPMTTGLPHFSAVFDVAGRRRSPATMPGYHAGRPPRNKGQLYPADPPTVEEIVAVMRAARDDRHGQAARLDRGALGRRLARRGGLGARRSRSRL